MGRRSRLDIYFDVLEAIGNGIDEPTRIMYDANLSWIVGCNVFDDLIKSDFIREEKEMISARYYLTEKGRNALSYYIEALEGLIQNEVVFPSELTVNKTNNS